jgi:hypothetical protein
MYLSSGTVVCPPRGDHQQEAQKSAAASSSAVSGGDRLLVDLREPGREGLLAAARRAAEIHGSLPSRLEHRMGRLDESSRRGQEVKERKRVIGLPGVGERAG